MDILHILGYIGALLTGLVLGLLGGGGAAVSIPILSYVFLLPASVATGYSLLIVSVTALFGTIQNIRARLVRWSALIKCGFPALVATYIMRRYIVHSIPSVFYSGAHFTLTKDSAILILLSFFMILVAKNMIWPTPQAEGEQKAKPYIWIFLQSVMIGFFTGTVGAGGGFLLIPLILSAEPMAFRNATATSLAVVMLNSFIGFIGDIQSSVQMDWSFLFFFMGFSVAGVVIGIAIANKIDNKKLREIFGYVMMVIAIYILIKEVLMKFVTLLFS